MARYPAAVWKRCAGSEPSIRPTQMILHTMVMRSVLACEQFFCGGGSGGIESHFGVGGKWAPGEDGMVRQWRDTEEQADANLTANRRPDGTGAISVETCDNAPRTAAAIEPWTDKQVNSLVRLGRWARVEHGIPPRVCRTHDDPGFGWHVMFGAPGPWTPVAKACPGPVRIEQAKRIVFPRIFLPLDQEVPDMTPAEFKAAMADPAVQAAIETAVQRAVEDALKARAPMGVVFVRAEGDPRGVFAVTPLGLIHADDPTVFSRMAGGKAITECTVKVHSDWITANMAHENEAPPAS